MPAGERPGAIIEESVIRREDLNRDVNGPRDSAQRTC